MSCTLKFALLVALMPAATYAQTEADSVQPTENSSAPVAHVYVTRPTHLDAFNVSSSGKLTSVPGSPFSNIALSHLSVNKKFLFGASDDGKDLITYAIASNGAVKKVAEIDTTQYNDGTDCEPVGPTQIDQSGATLYNFQESCEDTTWTQSYKIGESGELEFVNRVAAGQNVAQSPIAFLGNNKYAYITGGAYEVDDVQYAVYERQSNGELNYVNATINYPEPKHSGDIFSAAQTIATDPTNHLAMVLWEQNPSTGDTSDPALLISYTADSKGNLTTTNTYKDAATTEFDGFGAMSISPSGKLLATGGGQNGNDGFQIFHFDGGNPITKFTGVLDSGEDFLEFGWDKNNHLFALSTKALHVYSVSSTSAKEETGSPYSIPEASSVIVQSLN